MSFEFFQRSAWVVAGLLFGVSFALPARAIEMSPAVADLYTSVSIYPPSASSMTVCYGFTCRRRHIFDFATADRAALAKIMASGKASAVAERAAAQKAVIWFDRRLGPVLGTDKRVAKADFRHRDDARNYDCWDTTRNVTSLLLILQNWGMFKHHTVGNPHYRGNAFALQTPHNTAVLRDKATGTEWVVDMWTQAYLQPPAVMPVTQWVKED